MIDRRDFLAAAAVAAATSREAGAVPQLAADGPIPAESVSERWQAGTTVPNHGYRWAPLPPFHSVSSRWTSDRCTSPQSRMAATILIPPMASELDTPS